jgi:hypothetical protein
LPDKEYSVISEPKSPAGVEAKSAIKCNEIAMAMLSLVFTNSAGVSALYTTYDADWPNGKALRIMERLKKEFAPEDTITRVELRQMLNKVTMKPHETRFCLISLR